MYCKDGGIKINRQCLTITVYTMIFLVLTLQIAFFVNIQKFVAICALGLSTPLLDLCFLNSEQGLALVVLSLLWVDTA